MSFRILYFLGVAVFLFTLFTQIVIPSIQDKKLFPAFRGKMGFLRRKKAEALLAKEERILEKEIQDIENSTEAIPMKKEEVVYPPVLPKDYVGDTEPVEPKSPSVTVTTNVKE